MDAIIFIIGCAVGAGIMWMYGIHRLRVHIKRYAYRFQNDLPRGPAS